MMELNSGSYQIHILVKRKRRIKIGAIGDCLFPKGNYVYTGSAMKSLNQRVERHKRSDKKLRWHIDYLLADKCVQIIKIDVFQSIEREECTRNLDLLNSGNYETIISGFGASDCRCCPTHLLMLKQKSSEENF
jgi:Uri superfamily endonuclease